MREADWYLKPPLTPIQVWESTPSCGHENQDWYPCQPRFPWLWSFNMCVFASAVSPILGLAAASASLFTLASNSSQQSPSRGASAVTPSQAATGGNATAATATPQSSTTKQSKNSHQSIQEASDLVKAKINEILTLLKDSKVRSWLNWSDKSTGPNPAYKLNILNKLVSKKKLILGKKLRFSAIYVQLEVNLQLNSNLYSQVIFS